MIEAELKLLAIRAADGELDAADRCRLAALLDKRPDLRLFFEREKEAAATADALAADLRLPPEGLEEKVLEKMGMQPQRRRRMLWLFGGVAAAAVLIVVLQLLASGELPARTYRDTATFAPYAGEAALPVDDGAYHLKDGLNRVEVKEPTLLETGVGVVELDPGSYEVRVEPGAVTVSVRRGLALLRNAQHNVVVPEGETRTLPAVAVEPVASVIAVADRKAGAQVVGRVLDREGNAVEGARIWLSEGARNDRGAIVARANADGRFEIAAVAGESRLIGAQAPGYAPTDLHRLAPATRAVHEVDLVLRHKGGALEATVKDAKGAALAGATVEVGDYYRDTEQTHSPDGYILEPVGVRRGVSDASGIVTLDGMPPKWNRVRVFKPGYATYHGWVRIAPEGVTRKECVVSSGAIVHGTVRDTSGRPLAGAEIAFFDGSGARIEAEAPTTTDASGAYRVEHAPVGKVRIVAEGTDGVRTSTWLTLAEGGEKRWDAALEPARVIEGEARYESGGPVVHARVWCKPVRAEPGPPAHTFTDADGRFRFGKLGEEQHRVSIWYPVQPKARVLPPAKEVVVLPAESPIKLELPDRDEEPEPGFLMGVLVKGGGGAASDAAVKAWPPGKPGWNLRARTEADGTFRLGPLAPGTYKMELHLDGETTLHLGGIEVRSGETNDLGTLALPRGGRIRARVTDAEGELADSSFISVSSLDTTIYYTTSKEGDGIVTETLSPGRYLVRGGAPGLVVEAEVRDGEDTEVELRLRGGSTLDLTATYEDGSKPPVLIYRVEDLAGRPVFYMRLEGGKNAAALWLVSGAYRVGCEDGQGRKIQTDVEIPGGDAPVRLRLTLR